jgi:hypothetical protein
MAFGMGSSIVSLGEFSFITIAFVVQVRVQIQTTVNHFDQDRVRPIEQIAGSMSGISTCTRPQFVTMTVSIQ